MKSFAIASIIALASVASAQLDQLPPCALSCLLPALTADGCALTDFKCHCEKGASLLSTVTPCVDKACSAADRATVISGVQKTCADAGAPIVIPSAAVSSAVASASAAVSSAAASASAAVSSIESVIASSKPVGTPVPMPSGTAAPSGTMTMTNKPSASPPPFTGGAPQATKAAGLLGAAALAMLAL